MEERGGARREGRGDRREGKKREFSQEGWGGGSREIKQEVVGKEGGRELRSAMAKDKRRKRGN